MQASLLRLGARSLRVMLGGCAPLTVYMLLRVKWACKILQPTSWLLQAGSLLEKPRISSLCNCAEGPSGKAEPPSLESAVLLHCGSVFSPNSSSTSCTTVLRCGCHMLPGPTQLPRCALQTSNVKAAGLFPMTQPQLLSAELRPRMDALVYHLDVVAPVLRACPLNDLQAQLLSGMHLSRASIYRACTMISTAYHTSRWSSVYSALYTIRNADLSSDRMAYPMRRDDARRCPSPSLCPPPCVLTTSPRHSDTSPRKTAMYIA